MIYEPLYYNNGNIRRMRISLAIILRRIQSILTRNNLERNNRARSAFKSDIEESLISEDFLIIHHRHHRDHE